MRIRRAAAAAALALASSGAAAGVTSFAECIEGSDFIANAAGSRDNGMSREAFLDRLEGDFLMIRAFPVALRWFVKDAADERFLAVQKLAKLPRNSSKTRIHNRCELSGRPRGYYRKFGLCRIELRDLANKGMIPGVTKSSW